MGSWDDYEIVLNMQILLRYCRQISPSPFHQRKTQIVHFLDPQKIIFNYEMYIITFMELYLKENWS